MKKLLIFMFIVPGLFASGQNIKLLNSTRQDWAGGIAGMHGTNYYFELELPRGDTLIADSIWLKDVFGSLNINPVYQKVPISFTISKVKGRIIWKISIKQSYTHQALLPEKDESTTNAPIHHNGIALISYHAGSKTRYFTVKKILNTLPQVNYP